MKKAGKFTILLALWITLLFTTGMMMTFVNDTIQRTGFFGDTKFISQFHAYPEAKTSTDGWWSKPNSMIDPAYVWGARHYWYYWLCIILFLLSIVRIIIWVDWYWSDKPNNLKS